MPHLTIPCSVDGPVMNVYIAVSKARRDAIIKAGLPVPSAIRIRALVGTGASCTCIDPSIFSRLGLTPTGSVPMLTPSTGATPHYANQFDIDLLFLHATNTSRTVAPIENISAIESQLAVQGIEALIGRDVLSKCLLVYDGASNSFAIAF